MLSYIMVDSKMTITTTITKATNFNKNNNYNKSNKKDKSNNNNYNHKPLILIRFFIFLSTEGHHVPYMMTDCIMLRIDAYNSKVNRKVAEHIHFIKIRKTIFNTLFGRLWYQ